jgi:hypothetical protein
MSVMAAKNGGVRWMARRSGMVPRNMIVWRSKPVDSGYESYRQQGSKSSKKRAR